MAYIETLNGLNIAPKDAVRAFATAADMQAATDLADGMVCHTNGFHEEGDGGAAYYAISTEGTANGMDVLACQSGLKASLIVTEPYVTPEQFGAWGDGEHDDSAAINRAVVFSGASNYTIYLEAKTYLINSQINVSNPIKIEGVSSRTSVIKCNNCNGFAMAGAADVWISGVYIKHLMLEQTSLTILAYPDFNGESHYGVYLQCVNSIVEDVTCKGFNTGFLFYSNVSDISVYHDLVKGGENHCVNLCNAIYCNTGFALNNYDMYASKLTAGFCRTGISTSSCKLADCHVWGWFSYGYVFSNGATYKALEASNLELEACCAAISASTWNPVACRIDATVTINGFNYWNLGTDARVFYVTRDGISLSVTGLFVGNYGSINSSLVDSTALPIIVVIDGSRANCSVYMQGTILPTYLTGRVFLNNSTSCKCLSEVISANSSCTAYHVVIPNVTSKVALA